MSVTEIMNRLQAMLKDALPQLEGSLRGPANEKTLAEAEIELGLVLPEELRALYLLHDGEETNGPGLFMGLRFLPVEELVQHWKVWAELEADWGVEAEHYSVPMGWIQERYINRGWLPIGEDGGGNHIGIDLAPGPEGRIGQIINFGRDEETKYVIALTLTDMLQFLADTAAAGEFSVERAEEWAGWSYGGAGSGHFLDVIRRLSLPLGQAEAAAENKGMAQLVELAEKSLTGEWQERIRSKCGSVEALVSAKKLYFIREGLRDVEPLVFCREVRELALSANEISDVLPLRGCKQLKVLYIGRNPVTDVSPLGGLAFLQKLYMSQTDVSDLSPLVGLPKLRELEVEQTPVVDYSPLKQLASLRTLYVSDMGTDQLASLAKLEQLQTLSISGLVDGDAASHMDVLGKLGRLKTLHLKEMSIANLSWLASCTNLQTLKLEHVQVGDLAAVALLPNLRELEVNEVRASGWEQLAESTSIRVFTGHFEHFDLLKDRFRQKVDFSQIIGSMTDEQRERWHAYNS
jgi:internalin A